MPSVFIYDHDIILKSNCRMWLLNLSSESSVRETLDWVMNWFSNLNAIKTQLVSSL